MVKIRLITINNVNIFTIYEFLLFNVIKVLLAICKKTKIPGKMNKFRV